jgi:hypothetical protein
MHRKSARNIYVCLLLVSDEIHITEKSGQTFKFESEIVGEVSAFVVTAEKEEGVGVPDFQRP